MLSMAIICLSSSTRSAAVAREAGQAPQHRAHYRGFTMFVLVELCSGVSKIAKSVQNGIISCVTWLTTAIGLMQDYVHLLAI